VRKGEFLSIAGAFFWLAPAAWAQDTGAPVTFTWFIPLSQAVDLLQSRYAKPVTDEWPIWSRGDLTSVCCYKGLEVFRVKEHSFTLPEGLSPEKVPLADAVRQMVEAYNRQNPDMPRFGVLESKYAVHVVPVEVHDEQGRLVPARNFLDVRVSIPVERRTAAEHLDAVCRAVTAAMGRTLAVRDEWSFNSYFAANGYAVPEYTVVTGAQRQYMLFEWGVDTVSARDAIGELLKGSATTMTWKVGCLMLGPPAEWVCHVAMYPLTVGGAIRSFDRRRPFQVLPQQ